MERNASGDRENPTDDVRPPAYQRVEERVPSGPRAENSNMKAEVDIPYVIPAAAHVPLLTPRSIEKLTHKAHLSVLRRFSALYNLVENSAGSDGGNVKATQVELFLVCAESRYLSYLDLLELHCKTRQYAGTALPLPPWYHPISFTETDGSGMSRLYFMHISSLPFGSMPMRQVAAEAPFSSTHRLRFLLKDCTT